MSTGSGEIVKMEVDYSITCDEKLPQIHAMAKEGKLQEALEALLVLEKQTRTVRVVNRSLYF
jgi:26S proteasome regulatory subunit N5